MTHPFVTFIVEKSLYLGNEYHYNDMKRGSLKSYDSNVFLLQIASTGAIISIHVQELEYHLTLNYGVNEGFAHLVRKRCSCQPFFMDMFLNMKLRIIFCSTFYKFGNQNMDVVYKIFPKINRNCIIRLP